MDTRTIPLSELPVGGRAVVLSVGGPPELAARLLALGFRPDTELTCQRRAPLGDPHVYELHGLHLCLRRGEAEKIQVAPR